MEAISSIFNQVGTESENWNTNIEESIICGIISIMLLVQVFSAHLRKFSTVWPKGSIYFSNDLFLPQKLATDPIED